MADIPVAVKRYGDKLMKEIIYSMLLDLVDKARSNTLYEKQMKDICAQVYFAYIGEVFEIKASTAKESTESEEARKILDRWDNPKLWSPDVNNPSTECSLIPYVGWTLHRDRSDKLIVYAASGTRREMEPSGKLSTFASKWK